jgi:hypothetical protein
MESFRTAEGRGRARRPVARLVALGLAAAMAAVLLPGTALAAVNHIVVTPATSTVVQGTTVYFSAEELNGTTDLGNITATAIWATTDPLATCGPSLGFEACTFFTVGTQAVSATSGTDVAGLATVTVTSAGVQSFSVNMSAFYKIPSVPSPWDETIGVADTATVCALDLTGAKLTSYTGTIRFSSSDSAATLPANYTFVAGDNGCHNFSITFGSLHFQILHVNDISNEHMYGLAEVIVNLPASFLYHPLDTPVRLLDTRTGNGFSGKLSAGVPAGIPITNRGDIPWCAMAITANITVTGASAAWAVYLGPSPLAAPTSSTINFVAGQTVANSLTVEVNSTTGYVWATYISTAGNTTDLVLDVTGYYASDMCRSDGLVFHPLTTPSRVLDTRANNGFAGKLTANLPMTFPVADVGHVPDNALAVTGNLTVTDDNAGWAVYLGATPQATPSSSTINFTPGQTVANGVTVGLSDGGNLSATYIGVPGNTTDLVFDVTGYYTDIPWPDWQGDGLAYVPIATTRVLDSRIAGSRFYANVPQPVQMTAIAGIPKWADAVTGNLTVTDQTAGWAMYAGPTPQPNPATSNINFVVGQIVANGMTSGVHQANPWPAGEIGYLNVTYISTAGNTTNAVFDTTGYFEEWEPAHPVITTTPTPATGTTTGGVHLNDTALLTGADSANPGGTVTFRLYAPSNPTCTGSGGFSQTVSLSGLTAESTTGPLPLAGAGTYHWSASYSGDDRNDPATTTCSELVTIKATPTLGTTREPATATAGAALNDHATLTGASSPTGTITFRLYGVGDLTCSSAPIFTKVVTVATAAADTAPGFAPLTGAGTYEWTASYSGDANNTAASSACGLEAVTLT